MAVHSDTLPGSVDLSFTISSIMSSAVYRYFLSTVFIETLAPAFFFSLVMLECKQDKPAMSTNLLMFLLKHGSSVEIMLSMVTPLYVIEHG